MYKKHKILCAAEDLFQPLRGIPRYAHCLHCFRSMHVPSMRACPNFNASKAQTIPFIHRLEVMLHIQIRSYQTLLIYRDICTELAQFCVICNAKVANPGYMSRHHRIKYPNLHVRSLRFGAGLLRLANFIDGPGPCRMCKLRVK